MQYDDDDDDDDAVDELIRELPGVGKLVMRWDAPCDQYQVLLVRLDGTEENIWWDCLNDVPEDLTFGRLLGPLFDTAFSLGQESGRSERCGQK